MPTASPAANSSDTNPAAALSDEAVIARVRGGEPALFEIIMRRYNQRLYRVVRSIMRDEAESEDVIQDAYVRAYAHLDQFAGRARFSTWLTRIAVHEALARVRRGRRFTDIEEIMPTLTSSGQGPEQSALHGELRAVLEAAVDRLPEDFRTVFVLRDIEGLSTLEVAECVDIPPETVKTRLHRGRALLRRHVTNALGTSMGELFSFGAARCDRLVAAVLQRIGALQASR